MLDYDKSQKLMLANEAKHLENIQAIPGLNPDVVAAMCSLYRAGWRDCWMEEAKAHLYVGEDEPTAHIEEGGNVTTIADIDWQLLNKQKQWLLQQTGDEADGLIHLLDALEDGKTNVR